MGPRSFDRGKDDSRGNQPTSLSSFNGAAVFRPRKEIELNPDPRQSSGFNGAAVFRPRKALTWNASSSILLLLQWGRGLSTAESQAGIGLAGVPEIASMGPRSFDRGKRRSAPGRAGSPPGFNGAAVFRPRK